MNDATDKDGWVSFHTSQGSELRGRLVRLSPYAAAFELYHPEAVVQSSESLGDFRICLRSRTVYSGRAIVRQVVHTGTMLVCETDLDDTGFEPELVAGRSQPPRLPERFTEFVRQWQPVCKVSPQFKVAVADIRTFLDDLRRWLEQVELGLCVAHGPERAELERTLIDQLAPQVLPILDGLFEEFERTAAGLDGAAVPVHRSYAQRHLHPVVLCAPFAYRTYRKPLGYPGDYEMVNMMTRDPREGRTLFAKLFNVWLLQQRSAVAHRNRIEYLTVRLAEETLRALATGRTAQIYSLGCGPAREVQYFLARTELSNRAQFTLVDFEQEALVHAARVLEEQKTQHHRTTVIGLQQRSVQKVLKDAAHNPRLTLGQQYDLIYCAGLFDYLPDRTCKRLMEIVYRSLAPGGLAVATNVTPFSPNRASLELILDWHINYRDAAALAALAPPEAPPEAVRVWSDATGVNVFLEVRKPHETA